MSKTNYSPCNKGNNRIKSPNKLREIPPFHGGNKSTVKKHTAVGQPPLRPIKPKK